MTMSHGSKSGEEPKAVAMSEFLCIGDTICLYCEETEGYIFNWETSSFHSGLNIYLRQDRHRPQELPNVQSITFQVSIQSRFKLNKNYRKYLAFAERDPHNVEIKASLSQAKHAAAAEEEDNISEEKRQVGKKVRYGEIIQMRHGFTGKYVHISSTRTSLRDKNNMLVKLESFHAKHAQFRILPRYKVKSEGEYVQYGDQIVFESIKSPGHYFHASAPGYIQEDFQGSELNLGVSQTGFTLIRHTIPQPDSSGYEQFVEMRPGSCELCRKQFIVQSGAVLRFFHKDLEAYISAEGLFGHDITENVHLRIREVDYMNPKKMLPPTTAVTYWQIEAEESIVNGDMVMWEQQVRFRHFPTRQYLVVNKKTTEDEEEELGVGLTPDNADPHTVFRLHHVLAGDEEVRFGSYARIEHVLTGHWLHANKEKKFVLQRERDQEVQQQSSMAGLKWDGAEVRQLSAIASKRYVDVFTIQHVEMSLVHVFNYAAGCVPFITRLIRSRQEGRLLNAINAHKVKCALEELQEFMFMNGEPVKIRQKMLRNLQIVDLLVELLQNPLESAPDMVHLRGVYKSAYAVLHSYLKGSRRKNALYLAKYIDFFQEQLYLKGQIGLDVAQMLVELMRNNRKIVDRITQHQIDQIVGLLKERKNYQLLELLSVLCVCDGIAITNNQDYITEAWLKRDRVTIIVPVAGGPSPYVSTQNLTVATLDPGLRLSQNSLRLSSKSLVSNAGQGTTTAAGGGSNPAHSRTFSGQSDVYLVERGQYINRQHNVAFISTDAGCSWNPLHDFVNRDHPGFDEEKYQFLDRQLDLLGKIAAGRNAFAIRTVTRDLDILTWEQAFFCLKSEIIPPLLRAKYCRLVIDLFVDVGSNYSVLDQKTLAFVYKEIADPRATWFHEKNVAKDLVTVYPVVRDWLSEFLDKYPTICASDIGINTLIKEVLHLLHFMVRFGYYSNLTEIRFLLIPLLALIDGRTDRPFPKTHRESSQVREAVKRYHEEERFCKSAESLAMVEAKCMGLRVLELLFTFQANTRLESFVAMFKQAEARSLGSHSHTETGALLHCLHEDFNAFDQSKKNNRVQKAILRELESTFSESSFFDAQLIRDICLDLCQYKYDQVLTAALSVLNNIYSAKTDLFKIAVHAQVLLTQESANVQTYLSKNMPVLRLLSRTKLNNEQAMIVGEVYDTFSSFCHLRFQKDVRHSANQNILLSHGVASAIFDMLTQQIDSRLTDQYAAMERVWRKALNCLRCLTHGNDAVQTRVFERLDQLLSVRNVESEMALALREAFIGNQNNCLQIQPRQMLKIVNLVMEHTDNAPELLDLLGAIVKVEGSDLALKRNQALVMKYLMQYYNRIGFLFDKTVGEKIEILTSHDRVSQRRYLVGLVDLLSRCAEGENRYIESICQTILPVEELLTILNHSEIDNNLKKPYLLYLLWVYMRTAASMIESGAGDLPHDQELWKFIESLIEQCELLSQFIKHKPIECTQLLYASPVKSSVPEQDDVAEVAHGGLFYMFEAVMPFLNTFFTKFYTEEYEQFPNEPAIVDNLANAMLGFAEAARGVISGIGHLKTLLLCMPNLISASSLHSSALENFLEMTTSDMNLEDPSFEHVEQYRIYYEEEEALNRRFTTFAVNCSLVYGGYNTVHAQLQYKSDREYTELGGDEDLPLGEEFQNHVKCFIDEGEKSAKNKYRLTCHLVKNLEISASVKSTNESTRLARENLDIKTLQILRAIVHNEERKLPEDWESQGQHKVVAKLLGTVREVQNALNSQKAVIKCLEHLGQPSNMVVREVLALTSMMLFNANRQVQSSMLDYFSGTREESFFFAIRQRLQLSQVSIKEHRSLIVQHQARVKETLTQARMLQQASKNARKALKGWESLESTMNTMKSRTHNIGLQKCTSLTKLQTNKSLQVLKSRGGMGEDTTTRGVGPGGTTLRKKGPGGGMGTSHGNGLRKGGEVSSYTLGGGDMSTARTPLLGNGTMRSTKSLQLEMELTDVAVENPMSQSMMEGLNKICEEVEESVDCKDDGYILLVLKVLASMCDGQHMEIQNYLRHQPDNIKSINLVAEIVQFLDVVYANITENTIELLIQLFNTLSEFVAGNQPNRSVLLDNKIIDYINFILRSGDTGDCTVDQVLQLQTAIGSLLRSLTEENGPQASSVAEEVKDTVDKSALFLTMEKAYLAHSNPDGGSQSSVSQLCCRCTKKDDDEDWEEKLFSCGFVYFQVLLRFHDIDPTMARVACSLATEGQIDAYNFYKSNSMSIEILKGGDLQKVNFRVKNKNVLREEVKEKLKWNVDRSSPSNKIQDLMYWSCDILEDIHYQRRIFHNPLAVFFTRFWQVWNVACLLLSVAINFLMLVVWEAPFKMSTFNWSNKSSTLPDEVFNYVPKTDFLPIYSSVMYSLAGAHNVFSFFLLVSYILSNHPTLPSLPRVITRWREKKANEEDTTIVRTTTASEDELIEKKAHRSKLEVKLLSFTTLYYALFLALSISGTLFHGYFFAFHLLNIVNNNQLLQGVIKAVTKNGWSLLWVGILGVIILYIYALVSFAMLRGVFNHDSELYCDTLMQCSVTVVRYGLVGDIFDKLRLHHSQNTEALGFFNYVMITIFYISFFIFITTIGLNIIFGIIVDTFSELRDLKWQTESDMRDTCFICSRNSHDFEHYSKGFSHHVQKEHNMWAYIFFFIHLEDVTPTDYTALELHVHTLKTQENHDFFPLNKALCLNHSEEAEDGRIDEILSTVKELSQWKTDMAVHKRHTEERRRQRRWEEQHRLMEADPRNGFPGHNSNDDNASSDGGESTSTSMGRAGDRDDDFLE